jgi:hypothetical protein
MRGLAVLLLVAVLGGLLAVSGTAHTRDGGVPAEAAFRLADGSAGCAYADGRLACRTNGMRRASVLAVDGSTSAGDVPVSWSSETTVLRPTESWWHGGFMCGAAEGRLVCTTLDGGMLAVGGSRSGSSVVGAPAP